MMRHIFILVVFPLAIGFLLDTRNPQNSSNQFITASEFFAAKSGLQNGIEENRHDIDRKLMLLTSQVQRMFDSLQQPIPQKETNQSDEIVQKYQELSENYTALQKRFDILQANQMSQLVELSQCKSKVSEHDREISALMNLKHIQPLSDLSSLKNQVQSVSLEIHALSVSDRARSDDFLALYNMTLISERQTKLRFSQIETNHNVSFAGIQQAFKDSEVRQSARVNASVAKLQQHINYSSARERRTQTRLSHIETSQNVSITGIQRALKDSEVHQNARVNTSMAKLQQQIHNSIARVAMTACIDSSLSLSSGSVVKFDGTRTHYGISNLSSFRDSGKFTSESEGLYLVTSWIMSNTQQAQFDIYHNGHMLASAYVVYDTDSHNGNIGTATAVVAVELKAGDTVWVQTATSMYIAYEGSCLTIALLK